MQVQRNARIVGERQEAIAVELPADKRQLHSFEQERLLLQLGRCVTASPSGQRNAAGSNCVPLWLGDRGPRSADGDSQ